MGKLPVSNKSASYGKSPHIRKGYYPAQLLNVEPYNDGDGNKLKQCKHGTMLIFSFAIFKGEGEHNDPVEPMMTVAEEGHDSVPVVIASFIYHQYYAKDSDELQTAITPNSKITKLLKALGWIFNDEEGVDPEDFIGNWVEVNVSDYERGEGAEKYTASTIKEVEVYKGAKPKEELGIGKPSKKPEDAKEKVESKTLKTNPENAEKVAKLNKKLTNLAEMRKDDLITEEAFEQGKEQIYSQIEKLEK